MSLAQASDLAPSGSLARDDGVLLGFSSGAGCALRIALAEPGRWRGLVLMSMQLTVDFAALKKVGVRRVVFAAADDDPTASSLRAWTMRAKLADFTAEYVSLGQVGHHFAVDMDVKMAEAIRWVRATE